MNLAENRSARSHAHGRQQQVVAAAMIDCIVHHADVIPLKGSSHREHRNRHPTVGQSRNEYVNLIRAHYDGLCQVHLAT